MPGKEEPTRSVKNPDSPRDGDPGVRALAAAVSVSVRILTVILVLLLLAGLLRSCRIVKPHQVGWVFRFGAPHREIPPGDHTFVLPAPLETFAVYDVAREKVVETGAFLPGKPAVSSPDQLVATGADRMRTGIDGYLLTADENIVHCRAAVHYHITDAMAFAEQHAEPEAVLEALFRASVVEAAAELPAEAVLFDVVRFTEKTTSALRRRIDQEGLGVAVNRVVLRPFTPEMVREAFEANVSAGQQRDEILQQAEAYRLKTLNDASAVQERLLAQARADRQLAVERAEARAQAFQLLLAQYRQSGISMKQELHTETIRRVMAAAQETFLADGAPGRELRLQIGRSVQKPEKRTAEGTESDRND